jgi:glycosyltransferase involved in cell wall biosynthesis
MAAAMKFLIHSNTPTIATGYGMQVASLALRLQADGHDVAVSSTYGQQGEIGNWRGIRIYPSGWAEQSVDALPQHAMHWFEGDQRGGWIIILTDLWGVRCPVLNQFNVIGWCPVDHDPISPMNAEWFRRSCAHPVAMTRFGEQQLESVHLPSTYVPLAVDTAVYKPTFEVEIAGKKVDARTFYDLPLDAFVVGMVAMNKDPSDRKGFNEAFCAFAEFHKTHPNAVLMVHTEPHGIMGSGIDLYDVAERAGIPGDAIVFPDSYAYRLGFSRGMMAAAYTAMDVLLAPSHGEGFCVPLIEAQACGTPVIASNFTAQPELVGAGWLVDGQTDYDATHRSNYFRPFVHSIVECLEKAFAADLPALGPQAIEFAAEYDADHVFDRYWRPFLKTLEPPTPEPKPKMERVDIIVPFCRQENYDRLIGSFARTSDPEKVRVIVVVDGDALPRSESGITVVSVRTGKDEPTTYSEKVNRGYSLRLVPESDWVMVVGDDTEATDGWFETAQAISDRYDVIGTNDSEEGRIRNPLVGLGRHADHFFVRRSYIDDEGACLDGPGHLMPTAYKHWYTDKEVIELAKARGVYGHAHDCRIIHHHPGYDGREDLREADPVYMRAVDFSEKDHKTFLSRVPLIENHRLTRAL